MKKRKNKPEFTDAQLRGASILAKDLVDMAYGQGKYQNAPVEIQRHADVVVLAIKEIGSGDIEGAYPNNKGARDHLAEAQRAVFELDDNDNIKEFGEVPIFCERVYQLVGDGTSKDPGLVSPEIMPQIHDVRESIQAIQKYLKRQFWVARAQKRSKWRKG